MVAFSKAAAVLLAGLAAAPLGASQAEARDGRNAAIVTGAVLGAVAGAAIANAGDRYDRASPVGWNGDGYGYRGYDEDYYVQPRYVRPHYVYPRVVRRVYIEPAPRYETYGYRQTYRPDWRWRHGHRHHHDWDGGWQGDRND